MSAEKWRVVTTSSIEEVNVRAAHTFSKGELVCRYEIQTSPRYDYWSNDSWRAPRAGVSRHAATMHWEVVVILAPGELTPDERVTVERERCAAIAERVASERDSRADMAVTDRAEVRHRDVAATAHEIAATIRKGA